MTPAPTIAAFTLALTCGGPLYLLIIGAGAP